MSDPLHAIVERDPRYRIDAYVFVFEALKFTQQMLGRKTHVTGQELLQGARQVALDRYGMMAKTVLNSWGVRGTEDLGAIVFNLVNAGLMSKTDEDSIEDFRGVYDFDWAFRRTYEIPGSERDAG